MKVLIIGGTGQISRAISRIFLEAGEDLTLYHRGKTATSSLASYQTIIGDRTDLLRFEQQMERAGAFDCVIDMVCYRPEEAQSLKRAFKGRTGQVILCSSAAVYRRPAIRYPITEAELLQPTSAYGQNKARCEQILLEAHSQGFFNVTILRPANTYGPGGDLIYTLGWGNRFLNRIRKGKTLVSPGDGSTLRAYCHADDVAKAFVSAAGRPTAYGKAYHVTGEEWLSWDRYFEIIAGAMGRPLPRLVHIPCEVLYAMAPDRLADTIENYRFNNIFDNAAARQDLDFRYEIQFSIGVRQTIAWLDDNHRIQDCDLEPLDDAIVAAWDQRISSISLPTNSL
jgi:nucleoside-diphosphate-sugar epimerase